MAGPSIFQRNRIPLDASEPIPDVTENVWNGKTSPSEQAVPPEAEQVARPVQEPPEPLGKAKARKVGKPPEEGPPKPERRVCMVLLRASGAGQETCNQDYRYNGLHQGKPMFKAENGAVIYFNKFWKMNKVFKTTGWIYCTKDSNGSFPAEGRWSSEGTSDPNGAGRPPSLLLMDEPQPRVVDEESGALVLEDGQKVLKREENKSWRWNEVLVRSKEEILRSLLEPERPSGLLEAFHAPPEAAVPAVPAPVPRPKAPARPKEPKEPPPAAAPPAPAPAPAPTQPPVGQVARVRRAAPDAAERVFERSGFAGPSSRRFRPSQSTRESLALAVQHREQRLRTAGVEESRPRMRSAYEDVPPADERDAGETEMMVGGNVFRVRRLQEGDAVPQHENESGAPPSLQSMLAFIDAESAADGADESHRHEGYPEVAPATEVLQPKLVETKAKAECPAGRVADWTLEQVGQYLDFLGLSHIQEKFKENAVDGPMLLELSEEELCKELGLLKLQARKLLSRLPRDEPDG